MQVAKKYKTILKTLLKFAVTAIALYIVFRKIDLNEILEIYRRANPWLIIAGLTLFIASKVASSYRLNLYFRGIGIGLSPVTNLELYLLGMFYNLFLPGGIGGDGYKIYLLQKTYHTGTKKIFGAIISDRISGITFLLILALVMASFLNSQQPILRWTFILSPMLLLGFYLFNRWFFPHFRSIFASSSMYSLLVQSLQLLCVWLLLIALDIREQQLSYLVLFLVSSIVAIFPFTVGGVGAREITFLYGAGFLMVDANVAVGLSFLFYLLTVFVSLTGVWFLFRPVRLEKSDDITGTGEAAEKPDQG